MYAQNSQRQRDLTGGIRFPFFGGIIDFFMLVLQWFVLSVEVFLRRDFGERYLSKLNYVFGAVLLGFVALGALLFGWLSESVFGGGVPTDSGRVASRTGLLALLAGAGSGAMVTFWIAYMVAGALHLSRISWREAVGIPLHSLEWGRSWLVPVGRWVQKIGNKIGRAVLKLVGSVNKEKLPDKYQPFPDEDAVTECFVEPVFIWFLSLILGGLTGSFLLGYWLNFSAWALLITSNYRYYMIREQILDYRDQMIESTNIRGIMEGNRSQPRRMRVSEGAKRSLAQMAEELTDHPTEAAQIMQEDNAVTRAMAALKPELRGLQEQNRQNRPAIVTTTGQTLPENHSKPATPKEEPETTDKPPKQ